MGESGRGDVKPLTDPEQRIRNQKRESCPQTPQMIADVGRSFEQRSFLASAFVHRLCKVLFCDRGALSAIVARWRSWTYRRSEGGCLEWSRAAGASAAWGNEREILEPQARVWNAWNVDSGDE